MATELGSYYVSLVPSAKGIGDNIKTSFGGPEASAAFTAVGVAGGTLLAAGIAAAAKAAVSAAEFLPELGQMFHDSMATIRVDTGATGQSLVDLQGNVQSIFEKTPAGLDEVSSTVGTLHSRLKLSGDDLNTVSLRLIQLTRLTGGDLQTNLKNVSSLFNAWGVKAADMPKKLDELLRVSQATGVSMDDLTSQAAAGAATFTSLGLSFEDSISLIGNLSNVGLDASSMTMKLNHEIAEAAKNGKPAAQAFQDVFNSIKNAPSDTAAAKIAIDDFGARGVTMAKQIREGKFAWQDLSKSIKDGGDTIGDAASDTAGWSGKLDILKHKLLDELKPVADEVFSGLTTAATAVSVWFTDHKADIDGWIASFKSGTKEALGDFKTGLDELSSSWDRLKNDFGGTQVGQSQFGQALTAPAPAPGEGDWMDQAHQALGIGDPTDLEHGWDGFFTQFGAGIDKIKGTATGLWVDFTNGLDQVKAGWSTLSDFVTGVWNGPIFTQPRLIVTGLIDSASEIASVVGGIMGAFRDTFGGVWSAITGIASNAWTMITGLVSAGWESVRGLWDAATALLRGDWEGFWNGIHDFAVGIWDGIKAAVGGVLGTIQATASGITDIVKGTINSIIDFWNGLALPGIHINIPGIDKGVDWDGWQSPDIPKLAAGALVSQPTLALVGEGNGPEVVAPLPMLTDMANRAAAGGGGGPLIGELHVHGAHDAQDTAFTVRRELQRYSFYASRGDDRRAA